MGRSAYICKSKKCYSDTKIKLQKALKTIFEPDFFDIFKKKLKAMITVPIRNIIKLNYFNHKRVKSD